MKSNTLFRQCLDMLQRDDIKTDLKLLMSPVMENLLFELRPYIYVVLIILIVSLIILIVNFIMLIYLSNEITYFFRNNQNKINYLL
jgi:hypothetical protein